MNALEGRTDGQIKVAIQSENNKNIKILFADNGEGVSNDLADKIFEPFFTTKEVGKGTGLGLSIVYGIIKEHKGDIEYSQENHDSSFLITLPIKWGPTS